MGRTLLRQTALWADMVVAVWLAVALVLTLPAVSGQWLDSADADALESALDGDLVPDELEDDVLLEELVRFEPEAQAEVVRVVSLEPNAPHTSRLERPPIAAV